MAEVTFGKTISLDQAVSLIVSNPELRFKVIIICSSVQKPNLPKILSSSRHNE